MVSALTLLPTTVIKTSEKEDKGNWHLCKQTCQVAVKNQKGT